MSLPQSRSDGFLPVGVHRCQLSEIATRFATTTDRQLLHDQLTKVVTVLRSFPEVRRVIVDGCFVGSRIPTNDVDVVAVLEPPPNQATDWLLSRRLTMVRKAFAPCVELLWVVDGSAGEDVALRWMQRDKPEHGGALKGIVELEDFR